jgi:hypothetical protein
MLSPGIVLSLFPAPIVGMDREAEPWRIAVFFMDVPAVPVHIADDARRSGD